MIDERQQLHPLRREDAGPLVVADVGLCRSRTCASSSDGEQRHQHGGDALGEPVAQAVVRADDDALGTVVTACCYASWGIQIQAEQLGARAASGQQQMLEGQRDDGGACWPNSLLHGGVRHVHPEVAHAGDEVVQVGPDQRQHHELEEPAGHEAEAAHEGAVKVLVRDLGREAGVEHPDDERQQQEHQHAADAVQDRDQAGRRQAVLPRSA